MTMSRSLAVLSACLVVAGLATIVSSQQPPAGTAPRGSYSAGSTTGVRSPVGLIDLRRAFDGYNMFKDHDQKLKGDEAKILAWINAQNQVAQTLIAKRNQYTPGSQQFKEVSNEITKKKAEAESNLSIARNELADREAKAYTSTYVSIEEEVARQAQQRGFLVVFRHSSTTGNDQASVERRINGPVVYKAPGVDITDAVVATLNQRYGPPKVAVVPRGPASGGTSSPPPRPR